MEGEEVQYTLSLRDLLRDKLQASHHEAERLESTIDKVKEGLSVLGVGFAVFKGVEFIHEGIHAFHEFEQSMAQVEAGLESTGGAAGVSKEHIEEMLSTMSSKMKYGKADLADMAAQMLSFGGLTKENFDGIGVSIANVAARTGNDLHSTAIAFGKAMDNPAEGIKKLSRMGVMFSKQQEAAIDKLVAKGDIVGAQQIMLTEIQNKYGGSAEAAFNADPLARYDKMMGSVKLTVGELATSVLLKLMPAIEGFGGIMERSATAHKDAVRWMEKHKTVTNTVIDVVKGLGVAYLAYNSYIAIAAVRTATQTALLWGQSLAYAAAANGTSLLTEAMIALDVAMDANPVGVIALGIAAMAAASYSAYESMGKLGVALTFVFGPVVGLIAYAYRNFGQFHAAIDGTAAAVVVFGEIVSGVFKGLGTMFAGIFTGNGEMVKAGLSQVIDAAKDAGHRIGTAYTTGRDKSLSEFNAKAAKEEEEKKKEGVTKKGPEGEPGADAPKAKGNQSITVNVTIGNQIGSFTLNASGISESIDGLKRKVADALLEAVNDASMMVSI